MSRSVVTPATSSLAPRRTARARRWATFAVAANAAFVLSWLLAASWQGPRYSVTAHTISDMYADGVPGAWFLIIVLTLSGAAVLQFAHRSLWPTLRPAGWPALVGTVLLSTSIFGAGDLLTVFEREACRQADQGCSASDQLANSGGAMDNVLSTFGVFSLIAAGFFLAAAMKRVDGWQSWVRPTRRVATVLIVVAVLDSVTGGIGLDGLCERLLAAIGAGAIALLAIGVRRRTPVVQSATNDAETLSDGAVHA